MKAENKRRWDFQKGRPTAYSIERETNPCNVFLATCKTDQLAKPNLKIDVRFKN